MTFGNCQRMAIQLLLVAFSLRYVTTQSPAQVALPASHGLDNELTGDPSVECEESMLTLTFKTKKPFTGRIYVQGLADDERCSRNFATNTDQSKFSMMIQSGDCTTQRQRVTGTLEGVMLSVTIVVSVWWSQCKL